MKPERLIPEWGEHEFNYKEGGLFTEGISNCVFGALIMAFAGLIIFTVPTGLVPIGKAHPAILVVFALVLLWASGSIEVDAIAKIRRATNSKIVFYPEGFRLYDSAGKPSEIISYESVTRLDEEVSRGWSSQRGLQYQSTLKAGLIEFVFSEEISNYEELRQVFRHLARK